MATNIKPIQPVEMETGPSEQNRPVAVEVRNEHIWVTLADGRVIGTPLAWYPMLREATTAQLVKVDLLYDGICWPDLNECLSIEAMLEGKRPIPWTQAEWKATVDKLSRSHPIQSDED